MKIVYLSGPISLGGVATPEQVEKYLAVFAHHTARLRAAGYEVISPGECAKQPSWEAYMKVLIPEVCRAHVIGVLPDWELSPGSVLEAYIAHVVKTPVCKVEELDG